MKWYVIDYGLLDSQINTETVCRISYDVGTRSSASKLRRFRAEKLFLAAQYFPEG